ncbi:glycosyltransferase family 8 protein [Helicobacter pylori]|uniref:glycosyltransferase family 8 protein n=1 Tax=Helicobacter pylori TaxID=210 RepID=UPI0003F60D22|nr:glycosyltransferase family 8 protein [Helicobacter pylori]
MHLVTPPQLSSITIPIVVAFDNNYCIPAGVSLYSMLSCAKQEKDGVKFFYQIHCLVDNLSAENAEKLKQTIAPFSAFSSIEFCDISNNDAYPFKLVSELFLRLNSFAKKRFSKMILCRLLLASIFPQYEKIIMFDVDTLFVGDISGSFFIPMDKEYFGATKEDLSLVGIHSANDLFSSRLNWSKGMGVKLNHKSPTFQEVEILYQNPFNVGFMLVNLALWRECHLEEKLIDFFKARDEGLLLPEQDLFVLVCQGHILEMPCKYNVHPRMVGTKMIPKESDACMLHFYADEKPWKHFSYPYSKEWHQAAFKTSFSSLAFENLVGTIETFTKLNNHNKKDFFEFLNTKLNKKLLIQYILFKIFKKLESFCLR